MKAPPELIPASGLPARVRGFTTTCAVTPDNPFGDFNLATHVGDDPVRVGRNRERLQRAAALPAAPRWLDQVHGAAVVDAGRACPDARADAGITSEVGVVCAVLTADCLPVLFANAAGTTVAAAHAGWRGLRAGVLPNVVTEFGALGIGPEELCVWLGPAISAPRYEVDRAVRDAFVDSTPAFAECFKATRPGHWQCDLYALARHQLGALGVRGVQGGELCTSGDTRLQSYRRNPRCGRQATLVYRLA